MQKILGGSGMRHFLSKLFGERRKYGDIIALHEYSCVYFAIPKVANTSFKALISDLLKSQITNQYLNEKLQAFPFRHDAGKDYLRDKTILISFKDARELKTYWKFCFVRNPWDRLVSCFIGKILSKNRNNKNFENGVFKPFIKNYGNTFYSGMSFESFVDAVSEISDHEANRHFRSQHSFITDSPSNHLAVDFIGYLERVSDDFRHVSQKCGFQPDIRLPHLGKKKRPHYTEYYTRSMIEKVGRRYDTDIKIFGYEFDRIPPRRDI